MKLLLALALIVTPLLAQDGPQPSGNVFLLTLEEVTKINEVLAGQQKIIDAQQKVIERLRSSTGCT